MSVSAVTYYSNYLTCTRLQIKLKNRRHSYRDAIIFGEAGNRCTQSDIVEWWMVCGKLPPPTPPNLYEVRENERHRKMGCKVWKGENGNGRKAGLPFCQLRPPTVGCSAASQTQTHTHKDKPTSLSWSTLSHWHNQAVKAARRRDAPHTVSQFDRRPGSSTPKLAGLAGLLEHSFYHTNASIICTHG